MVGCGGGSPKSRAPTITALIGELCPELKPAEALEVLEHKPLPAGTDELYELDIDEFGAVMDERGTPRAPKFRPQVAPMPPHVFHPPPHHDFIVPLRHGWYCDVVANAISTQCLCVLL